MSEGHLVRRSHFHPSLIWLLAAAINGPCQPQSGELGPPPVAPNRNRQPESLRRLAGPAAAGTWFYASSRETVRYSYNTTIVPTRSVAMGWTGNVAGCSAGTTSQAYRDAVALRVNWFRAMSGIPAGISLDAVLNSKAQDAALMMSANRQLSHTPPPGWSCYTSAGAEAASHSNLCSWYGSFDDPGCVELYMQDGGANNAAVGHRRWLLYPQTTAMGAGDVSQTGSGPSSYPMANALWVLPSSWPPRPATRDEFVAWPPTGYVPYPLVPARWSFAYPDADFTAATVSMSRAGAPVPAQLETPQHGYGENTVVWVADNMDPNSPSSWPRPASDTTIAVSVSNVLISGQWRNFTYQVTIFDHESFPAPKAIWQEDSTGKAAVWFMGGADGLTVQGFGWLHATGALPWRVVGTADFDGNGKPDVIWQNETTRQASVWFMGGSDGLTVQSVGWLHGTGAPGWRVVGTADFDGNGKPDVIWQEDSTRKAAVWFMGGADGLTVQGFGWLHGTGAAGWRVAGTGDFDGNGKPDVIWQNDSTRQAAVWLMGGSDGLTVQGFGWLHATGAPGWSVVGAADFNGDGKPDVVWQNDTTRQASVWFMGGSQGLTVQAFGWLHGTGAPGWKVLPAQ